MFEIFLVANMRLLPQNKGLMMFANAIIFLSAPSKKSEVLVDNIFVCSRPPPLISVSPIFYCSFHGVRC
jgi:hypothetical protein